MTMYRDETPLGSQFGDHALAASVVRGGADLLASFNPAVPVVIGAVAAKMVWRGFRLIVRPEISEGEEMPLPHP